jgi:hypothetical protein
MKFGSSRGSNVGAKYVSSLTIFFYDFLSATKSQNFGEIRQIVRMNNGDLHIDFRDAEVADTVGYN